MNTLQQLVQVQTRQAELSALLTKQHVTNHLPVKEPPMFSGNVFDYPAFITAFDSIICDNVLSDKDRPTVEVRVYALLHDGSDSTLIKESVLKDLGVSVTEVFLKLSTMHGQNSVPVQRIDGLVVQKLDRSETPIPLPKGLFQRNNSIKKRADSNS
jgi:hypothetical protein